MDWVTFPLVLPVSIVILPRSVEKTVPTSTHGSMWKATSGNSSLIFLCRLWSRDSSSSRQLNSSGFQHNRRIGSLVPSWRLCAPAICALLWALSWLWDVKRKNSRWWSLRNQKGSCLLKPGQETEAEHCCQRAHRRSSECFRRDVLLVLFYLLDGINRQLFIPPPTICNRIISAAIKKFLFN